MAIRKRKTILLVAAFSLLILASLIANWWFSPRPQFDSQKWRADIYSRYKMPEPVMKGMSKNEVLKFYGKPEENYVDKAGKGNFIYFMPSGSDRGIYIIGFRNNVVDDIWYDNSANDSYIKQP